MSEAEDCVLVHGFMDSSNSPWMRYAKNRLEEHYENVESVYLGPLGTTHDSFTDYMDVVADVIDDVYTGTEIDVYNHSMGSIVARGAIELRGRGDKVAHNVSWAGPHQGAYLAWLLTPFSEGAAHMRPGDENLELLNEHGIDPDVEYINVLTKDDPLYLDPMNARIPGEHENVTNIELGKTCSEFWMERAAGGFELMANTAADMFLNTVEVTTDMMTQPQELLDPGYSLKFAERAGERMDEARELLEVDPEEIWKGHIAMLLQDETYEESVGRVKGSEEEPEKPEKLVQT